MYTEDDEKDEIIEQGEDGLTLLYKALNTQIINLSKQIVGATIDLSDKDDKTFDRLMKAMVESRAIAENLQWLKVQLGIDEGGESVREKKSINPIEARAKKKF